MPSSTDSSENWLVSMDRMFLSSDDSGIGRHIAGPFSDAGEEHSDRGPMEIKICRLKRALRPARCSRISEKNATCFYCNAEVPVGEYVILFPCGHWIQRICYHQWSSKGYGVKCGYRCTKHQPPFRSSDLKPEEDDVDEDELTDIEELLDRDNELANLPTHRRPATNSRAPSATNTEADTVYEGDVEDAGVRHSARVARRRRRRMEEGLAQMAEQGARTVPEAEEEPGHFFPEVAEDEEDFGMNSGRTLKEHMFDRAASRRRL